MPAGAGSHLQPRAEHWQQQGRHLQGSQGGSQDLPSPTNRCLPAPELSQSGQEGFFSPTPGLPLRLRCPQYSWSGETGLRQPGVCFAGWAGNASCLQKMFGGDGGREASDFLAPPHQHASRPQEMFQSTSRGRWVRGETPGQGWGTSQRPRQTPKSDPASG